MAFLVRVAILVAVASSTRAQFSSYEPQYQPEESKDDRGILTVPDFIKQNSQNPPTIALSLQLPKEEAPAIPFYNDEPNSYLNAPAVNAPAPQDNFFEYPVPSQDLKAPSLESWNPNNDPNLYFEIVKSEEPTNLYPKKYSKDIHDKVKPISSKPKEEITLIPISEKEFNYKQKKFDKTVLNLAKANNQKLVQADKVDKFDKFDISKTNKEQEQAGTAFLSHGELQQLNAPVSFHPPSQELNAGALGFHAGPSHHSDRVEFQMHGHAGPHTYKWGYDTGKGHNRHFRYEERDKHGIVKGHYGFYDKHGKLQVVNYDSHPHEGFHAEGDFGRI